MSTTDTATKELRELILKEREAGNIVFWGLPGELMTAKIDAFVQQPADGILYDLNRLEEISLTFLDDRKWVNDFAVAITIRKLKDHARRLEQQRDALVEALEKIRDGAEGSPTHGSLAVIASAALAQVKS